MTGPRYSPCRPCRGKGKIKGGFKCRRCKGTGNDAEADMQAVKKALAASKST